MSQKKYNLEHYVGKVLTVIWVAAFIGGSILLLSWIIKLFLLLFGVI